MQGFEQVTICHHNDMDGYCSAAIAAQYFREQETPPAIQFIEASYGMDQVKLVKQFNPKTVVVIVDYSFPANLMMELYEKHQDMIIDLVWIDHHKTSYEASRENNYSGILGLRQVGIAACQLTWQYFFGSAEMPLPVKLLGDWDIWDKTNPDTDKFQYGARNNIFGPADAVWNSLLDDTHPLHFSAIGRLLEEGNTIQSYQAQQDAEACKHHAFTTQLFYPTCIHPLEIIAINSNRFTSMVFDSMWDPEKWDAMLVFNWTGTKYRCSLYTTKENIDCSAIAKSYGGGGHKQAAGFELKMYPPPFTFSGRL